MGKVRGFKKKATVFALKFAGDDELDGLEVQLRSLPIREFLRLTDLGTSASQDPAKQGELTRAMFGIFAEALVGWNLQDEDGKDVEATLDGVLSQETDFLMRLFIEWQKAMGGVSDDLGKGSLNGAQSLEASLPMAVS